jgi:PPOX class probable FMN-dependent enzyme
VRVGRVVVVVEVAAAVVVVVVGVASRSITNPQPAPPRTHATASATSGTGGHVRTASWSRPGRRRGGIPAPATLPVREPGAMTRFTTVLRTEADLRERFRPPAGLAVAKEIDRLDHHCRAVIGRSPFVLVGTRNPDGTADVSPKGGPPGFVHVLDDTTLAMGELPGNNRLDSFRNVVADGAVGLLFLVPGVGETLRVNGRGLVVADEEVLAVTAIDGRRPKVALVVEVREAFVHCAKAVRRAGLWEPTSWPDVSDLSTVCMFADHAGLPADSPVRDPALLERAYQASMWEDPADRR